MDIITKFFTAHYKNMEDFFFQFPPERMQKEKISKENYLEWILQPSTINLEDYQYLEKKLGEQLPPILKHWHKRHFALERHIDVGLIHFPGALYENPFKQLEQYLFEYGDGYEDIRNLDLIPFACDANARGPLCFDCSDKSKEPNDYPIVLFEYDYWDKSDIAFTNFEKLLECTIDLLNVGNTDNFSKIDTNSRGLY